MTAAAPSLELLPCPMCGARFTFLGGMCPWVECACGVTGPSKDTEAEAVAAWNTRAALQADPVAADIDAMVNKFLGWRFPDDFHPDAGIQFTPIDHPLCWPIGTNLLTADQAKAMFQHCYTAPPTDALPAADELFALLPGTHYMDPPDGGDVSVIEQLRRMAKDAESWRNTTQPTDEAPAKGDDLRKRIESAISDVFADCEDEISEAAIFNAVMRAIR